MADQQPSQGSASGSNGSGAPSEREPAHDPDLSFPDELPPARGMSRLSFAAIGHAVRGIFRSASEDRAAPSQPAPSQRAVPQASDRTTQVGTTPMDGQDTDANARDASSSDPVAGVAPLNLETGAEQPNAAQAQNDQAAGPGVEEIPLSPFAEAIQHAAAANDEMHRARGSRPTSPAFGTAQRVTPPPSEAESSQVSGGQDSRVGGGGSEGGETLPGYGNRAAEVTTSAPTSNSNSDAPADSGPASEDNPAPGAGTQLPNLVLFRLPFTAPDGRQALLAFRPVPLPGIGPFAGDITNLPSDHPLRAHPHPGGHVPINPIFVPVGVSPFAFALLYDANHGLGWPVVALEYPSPQGEGEEPARGENRPHLAAGMPFQISFHFQTTTNEEVEEPSKEMAEKYVADLERADAELRERMARLGLGDIGDYSDPSSSLMDTHGTQGCGICLEPFATEDKPEWVVGKQRAEDEAVVAVPCAGHHTLHASCLRGWLENVKPSAWTCPFCRGTLTIPPSIAGSNGAQSAQRQQQQHQPRGSASPGNAERSDEEKRRLEAEQAQSQARSLRDEVRLREKQRGWRCDAAACLPRYPADSKTTSDKDEGGSVSDDPDSELLELAPCHHEIHVGCLKTAMRIQADLLTPITTDAEDEADDEDGDEEEAEENAAVETATLTTTTTEPIDVVADTQDRKRKRESDPNGSPPSDQDESLVMPMDAGGSTVATKTTTTATAAVAGLPRRPTRRTVGKWVSCPACRSECWAEIPVDESRSRSSRRRRRNEGLAG
ncbi:unnamed protein product [Tilletia controversa]|nr:unnamed protein product [Tilletia controversa]